ncbi:hypothetical protein PIIN_05858 [Serendipita indica DSM 11827]|uniref:Uncharacterized protein n=1 Tax=Serendipita indica (strain DSM 11827) TaxID=1109443 RepID=G4TKT0_SERID|nr:hypothetical protein PIIN_05858 [Serendipita indica DSM 11827]
MAKCNLENNPNVWAREYMTTINKREPIHRRKHPLEPLVSCTSTNNLVIPFCRWLMGGSPRPTTLGESAVEPFAGVVVRISKYSHRRMHDHSRNSPHLNSSIGPSSRGTLPGMINNPRKITPLFSHSLECGPKVMIGNLADDYTRLGL